MTTQEQLARIVELVGTDPKFDGLGKALTAPCNRIRDYPEFVEVTGGLEMIHHRRHPDKCPDCHGTGRVLRSWKDLPQGALNGVLKHWIETLLRTIPEETLVADKWYSLAANLGLCFGQDNCDDRAVEQVLEYVKKMKEASHEQVP